MVTKRERYAGYKSRGVCPNCLKSVDGDHVYCMQCRANARQKTFKERHCLECGVAIPAVPGKRIPERCASCARNRNLRMMRDWYKNLPPEHKQAMSQSHTEYARRWRSRNSDQAWDTALRRRYGITLEMLRTRYENQNGKCAICRVELPALTAKGQARKALHVDHCHETGRVRGLLCPTCNVLLGLAKDSTILLTSAVHYLTIWKP